MKRRSFLKAGAGVMLGAPLVFARHSRLWSQSSSPLAIAYSGGASTIDILPGTDNRVVNAFEVDPTHIQCMMDTAIQALTGKGTTAEAWESLFPAGTLTNQTKVAIKINLSYGCNDPLNNNWRDMLCPVGCKAAVSDAVVNGLTQMLGGTYPIDNITIFDKDALKFWNRTKMVVQGYPASAMDEGYSVDEPGAPRVLLFDPAEQPPAGAPTFTCGVSGNMVTQTIVPSLYEQDFVINISIPKVHEAGGITGAMKNTYGCTYDCGTTHGGSATDGAPGVTPCLPEFYRAQDAVTPCLVNILDAIGALYDGSAAYSGSIVTPNIIAASHDPVTLDCYQLELINQARRANGMHDILLSDSMEHLETPQWQWPGGCNEDGYINAAHLVVASEPPFSLGYANTDLKLYNDVTALGIQPVPVTENAQARIGRARRIAGGWRLPITADRSGRAHAVRSRIVGLDGTRIRSLRPMRSRGEHLVVDWDCRNESGLTVAPGVYSWETTVDGRRYTQSVRVR
ncbi:MAG: DUF362 domain-containing protein [Chitinivibrionales bacterium]|nr:DUF362 domain-containing protein [Chitinivibrionales bacterium]